MRSLALNTFVSLDGVTQAPGGPHEDPTGGFTHGGWAVNYFDAQMIEKMAGADPYELLLGRGTYEIFAAHWPYDEGPIADHLNRTRKHVASTTLERVEWNNSTLIARDLADYVKARMREHGPEIQVHGSPSELDAGERLAEGALQIGTRGQPTRHRNDLRSNPRREPHVSGQRHRSDRADRADGGQLPGRAGLGGRARPLLLLRRPQDDSRSLAESAGRATMEKSALGFSGFCFRRIFRTQRRRDEPHQGRSRP